MHPGVVARAGRLRQGLGERGEVAVAELAEGLARGQADQGQPAAGDVPGPVRAPSEPLRYFGDLLHVAGMPGGPLQVKVTGSLGEQQIQVGREVAFHETPAQERPCAGALQVGQPRRGRPPHPRRQLRMHGQQPSGGVAPDPPAVRADRQRGDRVGVGDQQVRRPLAAQGDGGRGAHRAAALARAYSAASVSGDRWVGVYRRAGQVPVAEHLADLGQGRPTAQHVDRERMPQPMRPHRALTCPLAAAGHGVADRARADGTHRRQPGQEHRAGLRPRAPVPEIRGNRFADIARQRQASLAAALAAHPQQARPPVKIAEFQAGHLARAQTEAGQQQQDRMITQSGGLPTGRRPPPISPARSPPARPPPQGPQTSRAPGIGIIARSA